MNSFRKEEEWLLPRENILAVKLKEIQDLPKVQRLSILCVGSIAGEEDVISR